MKASVLGMTDGAIIQTRLLPILSADRDNNIVLLRHIMVIEKRRMLHILMLTLAMVSTIEHPTRIQVEMVPRQPDVDYEDSVTTEQRAALEKESDARQHYKLRVDKFGEQSQQRGGKS